MPSKDYDYYKITLKGTGNKIESNMELDYDTDGNLIKSTEHIKNFAPPETIRYALANSYPGWTLKKDAFDLIQFKDGKEKEHYQLTLAKNGREIKVYTDIDGNLLNNKTNS